MAVKFEGAAADRWPSEETRDWVFVAGVGGDQRLSRPAIHLPDPGHKCERGNSPFACTGSSLIVLVSVTFDHAAMFGGRIVSCLCTGPAVFHRGQKIVIDMLM